MYCFFSIVNCYLNSRGNGLHGIGNNQKFWKTEWEKHGTCSLNSFTQAAYFQLALHIKVKNDLVDVLKKSGIVPRGTPYDISRIVATIKSHNDNKEPGIMCTPATRNSLPYLQEIRLCFYANGTTSMDCPHSIRSINCHINNRNHQLLFPL
jgi:ribonuclease T2